MFKQKVVKYSLKEYYVYDILLELLCMYFYWLINIFMKMRLMIIFIQQKAGYFLFKLIDFNFVASIIILFEQKRKQILVFFQS